MRVIHRVRIACLLLVCSALPMAALAVQIDGKIVGSSLQWESATVSSSNTVIPSYWDVPVNLPAGSAFIPGGLLSTSEQGVSLRQVGGTKWVSILVTPEGMDYRVSGAMSAPINLGSGSPTTESGNIVSVRGLGIGNKKYLLERVGSPFSHSRPVVSIDGTQVANAFRSANAPEGRYQGTLVMQTYYDYVRDGIRIRHSQDFQLTIEIDYSPVHLNAINVTGQDALTLEYHYPLQVSGKTTYTITADGYFSDGIWMRLMAPENGSYFSFQSATTSKEFKYSVTCTSGCGGGNLLIVDGAPQIDDTTNRTWINAVNTGNAQAELEVSFDRISETEFRGDTYQGKFVLIFEARI